MIDLKKINELMKIAKDAVKDENDDSYRFVAYQVVLGKLLDSNSDIRNFVNNSTKTTKTQNKTEKQSIINTQEGKQQLAKNCKITTDAIDVLLHV